MECLKLLEIFSEYFTLAHGQKSAVKGIDGGRSLSKLSREIVFTAFFR